MVAFADKPLLEVESVEEWERFLENDPPDGGVRLKLLKKTRTGPGIQYPEALDVALCHGWIDGQVARFDDDYVLQAFTPRRARSPWSQINREHVERLIAEGRMRPGGQAEIDRAKADGRWDAAYRQKGMDVPDDLQAAIDASPAAAEFFATLSKQNRFAMVFRLGNLKRPENRARRIAEYVAMLERGETLL
ncbi:YdeI/OmpD-associated family protein [Herbiconiux sp. SYSU D00978]|uniref:YdeI/OmpD-associated family protein n=1 Tax=Herbiconiux sp. SYSU D00978 TaxID=2812562 RepID=UPI001A97A5FB|nr:YdeI/OmpD-associated family protein [Herbiconiux sp. SYSU D00978]